MWAPPAGGTMGAELDLVWNKVFQEDKNHQREESNQLAAGGQLIGAPLCPLTDTLTLMLTLN